MRNGRPLDKYTHSVSPLKQHPNFNRSPSKSPQRMKMTASNITVQHDEKKTNQNSSLVLQNSSIAKEESPKLVIKEEKK